MIANVVKKCELSTLQSCLCWSIKKRADILFSRLLCIVILPRGGIGYCADLGLLRLTPFPSARRRDSNGEAVEPIPLSADT